jgi:preprotein translocase subunit SecE
MRKFLNDVVKEMKKVKWPNKKDMLTYSSATLAFVIFFALFFALLDGVIALAKMVID